MIGKRSRILFDELFYLLKKDDMPDTLLSTGDIKTNNYLPSPESRGRGKDNYNVLWKIL